MNHRDFSKPVEKGIGYIRTPVYYGLNPKPQTFLSDGFFPESLKKEIAIEFKKTEEILNSKSATLYDQEALKMLAEICGIYDEASKAERMGIPVTIEKKVKAPHEIEKVIFNDPATIVFWKDGTKTVVKAQNGEAFDPEKGLAMAFFKKMHGNTGRFNNIIHTWVGDYKPEEREPHNELTFGYPNGYSMEIDFPKDLDSKELDCMKNGIVREVKMHLEAIRATRKMRKSSDAE